MNKVLETDVSALLEEIGKQLDISPSTYQLAVERYEAVSKWISDGTFDGAKQIHFYPQGSFRYGTVVRPIKHGKEAEYDIDLVCELHRAKNSITPEALKNAIGGRLAENEIYKERLDEEGRRCWTLNYAEKDGVGFHLDVLPAVPEEVNTRHSTSALGVNPQWSNKAIAITHKNEDKTYKWSASNPNGYAEWFASINKPSMDLNKSIQQRKLFESNREFFARIDDVPEALIKTPLQRAIQILKRHRDLRFANHPSEADKPISMIITTLAAQLYQNEPDVLSTLRNIVTQLNQHLDLLQPNFTLSKSFQNPNQHLITRSSDGKWFILNPVNPDENFADRWHEDNNRRARAFFDWVKWVKEDVIEILAASDIGKIVKSFETSFGQVSSRAARTLRLPLTPVVMTTPVLTQITSPNKPWSC